MSANPGLTQDQPIPLSAEIPCAGADGSAQLEPDPSSQTFTALVSPLPAWAVRDSWGAMSTEMGCCFGVQLPPVPVNRDKGMMKVAFTGWAVSPSAQHPQGWMC